MCRPRKTSRHSQKANINWLYYDRLQHEGPRILRKFDDKQAAELANCHYRVSLKAIITSEHGEILLVQERDKGWDLPGGGLDWGESPKSALIRELHEELGCAGEIDPQPHLVVPWSNPLANVRLLWIMYQVELDPDNIRPTKEVKAAKFFSLEEYIGILALPEEADWVPTIDYLSAIRELVQA